MLLSPAAPELEAGAPAPAALDARARELRTRFPALRGPRIRLDGPAGSQVPQTVIDAVGGYLADRNANLGNVFAESIASTRLVADARAATARFLGATHPAEVGSGLNATSVNVTLIAAATKRLRPSDEIVVTVLDHDANSLPWRRAAAERGLVLHTVGLDAHGHLDLLGERFLHGLRGLRGITLHGEPGMDGRTATFALTSPGIEPLRMAGDLAARGVAVGAGEFHAAPALAALGAPAGAVRLGFLHYNTASEVDAALRALAQPQPVPGRCGRADSRR